MRMKMLCWIHPACIFLGLLRKLNSWFLSCMSWECPIDLFQLVRTESHTFPPQSQGPECSWIQEVSKIGMGRGKLFFFSHFFGHWFGHFKSKICFIEANSFIKTAFELQHHFTVKYFEWNFVAENSHRQKFYPQYVSIMLIKEANATGVSCLGLESSLWVAEYIPFSS